MPKRGQAEDEPAEGVVARFAAAVRRARERRQWSQAILAESCGVSPDVIRRLEAVQCDPKLTLVAQLTRVLEINLKATVYNQVVARRIEQREES